MPAIPPTSARSSRSSPLITTSRIAPRPQDVLPQGVPDDRPTAGERPGRNPRRRRDLARDPRRLALAGGSRRGPPTRVHRGHGFCAVLANRRVAATGGFAAAAGSRWRQGQCCSLWSMPMAPDRSADPMPTTRGRALMGCQVGWPLRLTVLLLPSDGGCRSAQSMKRRTGLGGAAAGRRASRSPGSTASRCRTRAGDPRRSGPGAPSSPD